jgi:hypothetical protein
MPLAPDVRTTWPRPLPMGVCWCGCGTEVPARSFFHRGHDRKAEGMLKTLHYGSVADLLAAHGYGPENSLHMKTWAYEKAIADAR